MMENPIPGQRWRAKKNPDFIVEVETVTHKLTKTTDETLVQFSEPGNILNSGTFNVQSFRDLYEPV